ncbi:MAG: sugar transferase [Xenococcus sp. MO_188.B8]|nr:sugar transferase [Xenococcus sp. MO_188.B8]
MSSPIFPRVFTWLLFISDFIGLILCFNLAFVLRLEQFLDLRSPLLYGLIIIYLLGLYISDGYKFSKLGSQFRLFDQLMLGILATVTAITALIYLTGLWGSQPLVGRGILLISVIFFTIWVIASRTIVGKWINKSQEYSRFLILGSSNKALSFRDKYQLQQRTAQFVLLTDNQEKGSLLHQQHYWQNSYNNQTALATEIKSPVLADHRITIDSIDNLHRWCKQSWSGILIDDISHNLLEKIVRNLMTMRLKGIYIYNLADFCEQVWHKIPPAYIKDDWVAFASGFSILHHPVHAKLKQTLDVAIAFCLLGLTFPLMIIVAIAIKLDSPGSIFYSQVRTGLNGQQFRVYKFRSMQQDAEKMGLQWTKKRDPRITRVGYVLRVTRIDELPQLWNVIKGNMSLIGPRPERPEFDLDLRREIPYYDLRYLVKPGITGWAQVCYPYGASVEDAYQKLAYDLYYIKNYSLGLDFVIALKTFRVIILGKGR